MKLLPVLTYGLFHSTRFPELQSSRVLRSVFETNSSKSSRYTVALTSGVSFFFVKSSTFATMSAYEQKTIN